MKNYIQLENKTKKIELGLQIAAVTIIVALVTFSIPTTVVEFLFGILGWNSPWLVNILVSLLVDCGLYVGIFKVSQKLCNIWIVLRDKRMRISGRWYHVHIPNYEDGSVDYSREELSVGYTDVERNYYDFRFHGENVRYGKDLKVQGDQKTTWDTQSADEQDCKNGKLKIIETYSAETTGGKSKKTIETCPICGRKYPTPKTVEEAGSFRQGVHNYLIRVSDEEEVEMTADYQDCWPSLKLGRLYFFRTEKQRDEKVKEYFDRQKIQA